MTLIQNILHAQLHGARSAMRTRDVVHTLKAASIMDKLLRASEAKPGSPLGQQVEVWFGATHKSLMELDNKPTPTALPDTPFPARDALFAYIADKGLWWKYTASQVNP